MKRLLIIGQIHEAGLKILEGYPNLEIEIFTDPGANIPVNKVEQSDAILIRYGVLTEDDIQNANQLSVVSRHGVGCDNLPVTALTSRGIPVTIVGPVNAISVAEQTMAMMLTLSKKIVQYDNAVRSGNWSIRDSLSAAELSGKSLLLLGFGRIGREVAKRALAFDMDVQIYDPFVSAKDASEFGVSKVKDWQEIIHSIDVLSIHLPFIEETKNIINADVLAKMKPTAILLNAARGGLIDEDALYQALKSNLSSGGAGIDTFAIEPLNTDSPLLELPNVIVSPHSSALTEEAAKRMGVVAAQNIIAGLENTIDSELLFNPEVMKGKES